MNKPVANKLIYQLIEHDSLDYVVIAGNHTGLSALFFVDANTDVFQQAELVLSGFFPQQVFFSANLPAVCGVSKIENLLSEYTQENFKQVQQIPKHPSGTPFQQLVWQQLDTIAWGKSVNYSDIAMAINKPAAVRAVANAVGQNRLSIITPCHRGVRKSGAIGGYRWGRDRKTFLLSAEGRL